MTDYPEASLTMSAEQWSMLTNILFNASANAKQLNLDYEREIVWAEHIRDEKETERMTTLLDLAKDNEREVTDLHSRLIGFMQSQYGTIHPF